MKNIHAAVKVLARVWVLCSPQKIAREKMENLRKELLQNMRRSSGKLRQNCIAVKVWLFVLSVTTVPRVDWLQRK